MFLTLSIDAVSTLLVPQDSSHSSKVQICWWKKMGGARDANMTIPKPLKHCLLIGSHQTSAIVGINMADTPNKAHGA
jgi:hypothetical protein